LNNIISSFSVVYPLILQMSIGYILRRKNITDDHSLNIMNKMVFRVFLPMLLFLNIYSLKPEEALNRENRILLLITYAGVLLITVLMHLFFPVFIKDKKKCSVMIQGTFRSNLILFGIPIAASIYGEDHIGTVSLLAAFTVPLFNALAVVVLEYYRSNTIHYRHVLISIFKNPLIIASVIAFAFLILRIKIPGRLLEPVSAMSKIATPLAFVILGGTFQFRRLAGNLKYLVLAVLGKLVLFPLAVLALAISLGYRNEAIVALIGAIAAPTAVSSFTMAIEMDADAELAGQIVVFTSIISILTLFLWVLILKTQNYI
jgi:predicted permease